MKRTVFPMMLSFLIFSTALAGPQSVVLGSDSSLKYQDFLKRNPTYLSLSHFWIESFQEPEPQLEGLLDLCVLELTATPSPQSCEVYLKRRAELPMGSFDHNLFLKLRSRLQSDNFKDERIKKWLKGRPSRDPEQIVSLADLRDLIQKLRATKVLVQGRALEDQTLSRNTVYQWTFLKDDAYPLTILASYEELSETQWAWTKLENEDLKILAKKFPEQRFIQLNSDGETEDQYESQLSPFQVRTKQQLSDEKSWGTWKLPVSLLVTGILIHTLKDKEIKITGFSF